VRVPLRAPVAAWLGAALLGIALTTGLAAPRLRRRTAPRGGMARAR
jgi:hypothetical protein